MRHTLRRLLLCLAFCLAMAAVFSLLAIAAEPPVSRLTRLAGLSQPSALAKGKILVARRGLPDPNFRQTVVLLLEYSEEETMGVIINRPTEVRLAQLWPEDKKLAERRDVLHEGGPVAPNSMLMLVLGKQSEHSRPVFGEVSASSSREWLEELVATGLPPENLRVYSGYAGWTRGQLDYEVQRGDWLVWTPEAELVFSSEPKELWPRLIRHSSDLLAAFGGAGPDPESSIRR